MRQLLLFILLLAPLATADKSVIVSLTTKWSSSSLIAEASEFVGKEGNSTFYKFVSAIADATRDEKWDELSSEKKYEMAVKAATPLLSPSAVDLLRFSLAIRAYSPAVQLFQQVGEEYSKVSCAAFFDVHGVIGCSTEELAKAVEKAIKSEDRKEAELLSVDHILAFSPVDEEGARQPLTIIVYGEVGAPAWAALHSEAKGLARQHKGAYVHRHFVRTPSSEKVALSGYGVELAIKNTEYKAEDDSNKKSDLEEEDEDDLHGFNIKLLKELHPSELETLSTFRMHLKETQELAPLKVWQVQNLAYQAVAKIMNVGTPQEAIPVLKELSQNFPLHARSLASEAVSDQLKMEVEANQNILSELVSVEAGESALFINGINLDVDSLDLFQLIDTLQQEEKLASGFAALGFKREYLPLLANIDLSEEKPNYAVDYREAKPFYINNLDTDKRYADWGNSVKLMLQPYYPGMIRPIARNLFTLVFVIDPADSQTKGLLTIAYTFFRHAIPLRIGVSFVVTAAEEVTGKEDVSVAVLNLFNYVKQEKDIDQALLALTKLYSIVSKDEPLTVENVRKYFEANYDGDYDEVFGAGSEFNQGRDSGREFLAKTSLGAAPKVMLNGFVLDDAGIRDDKFEETVMMEVMRISPKIQRAVMNGKLKDKGNVQNWLIEQPDVMPRLNRLILDAPTAKRYIDLSDITQCSAKTPSEFSRLSDAKKAGCVASRQRYAQRGEEDSATRPITLWIAADLDKSQGRRTLYSALKHIKFSNRARVGLLANPEDEAAGCRTDSLTFLVHAALRTLPPEKAKLFVPKLLKEENAEGLAKGTLKLEDLAVSGMDVEGFLKEKKLMGCDRIKMERTFANEVVGLAPGEAAVIANGLIIGPLESDGLGEEDIPLLEKLLVAEGAEVIAEGVDQWKVQRRHGKASDVAMRAFALIGQHAVARKRQWIKLAAEKHSVLSLPAEDEEKSTAGIVAVVDPLSRSAQKLSSILELLRAAVNCDLKIIFNPKAKLSELPLKRFYRYVGDSELGFDPAGGISPPRALFTSLPSKQLLTLSVHPPDSWMVEAVSALYDLDNIKMEQVANDVIARFSLEHILLEGHCFEEQTGSPPRGLQFVLGTPSSPTMFDTIVMANLGYFQLKASPGSWQLRFREGKSKDIYQIATHSNTEGAVEQGEVIRVLINSFAGRTVRVRVAKREGKEEESLLNEANDDSTGGKIWNTISNTIVGSGGEKHETINVFSLASGHLYERFMRIMILSVVKQTKSPVKFWLLKNYLSPQFKESLPLMAEEYGFEYALVEYKWPRWLHQQKEKHRIMWGYKILFLDVLFPLDVHKIIFVDADQVVRADLLELMNFDLSGAPYGYVPFCESRKEMDGFRFWKQGYWANHLAGRQYHISALYVIDLQKFRQIAAGDRLRGQYQGLSADPNSLSNLDQDLPNNMLHQVRIKSLPQEWLWCETWCDDASKTSAKTIDLCNNPLTKEPKLDSAMRIIPEWKAYDAEIKEVIARGAAGGKDKGKKTAKKADPASEEHQEL